MKILWASNSPNVATGYGIPTRNLMPFILNAGHELAIQAMYGIQGGSVNYGDVMIYPAQGQPYGIDTIGHHAKHFGAELVVTLMDNWVLPTDYHQQFKAKWLSWFPVDGSPAPAASVLMASKAEYPAVFSLDGVKEMRFAGISDIIYLPYGIDCSVFYPGDRRKAKVDLGFNEDTFLVSTVAANRGFPSRKAFPEILMGFKAFAKDIPNAHLYLHTRAVPVTIQGVHLEPLIQNLNLGSRVTITDPINFAVGVPNEELLTLYQASDVMLLPSMGEGFGLPIAEAQACGCPVITQACSSMTELTINGIAITPLQPFWADGLNYWWSMPSVPAITDALHSIYAIDAEQRERNATMGINHFVDTYNYPVVWEKYWMPLLQRIEAELW